MWISCKIHNYSLIKLFIIYWSFFHIKFKQYSEIHCGISFIRGGQSSWVANWKFSLFLGTQFVGIMFVIILKNTSNKQMLEMYMCSRVYDFVGKGYPRKPQTLIPYKQWWFHSILKIFFLLKKRGSTTPILNR